MRLPLISTKVAPLPRLRRLTLALPVALSSPAQLVAETPREPALKLRVRLISLMSVAPTASRRSFPRIVRGEAKSRASRFRWLPVTTISSMGSLPSAAAGQGAALPTTKAAAANKTPGTERDRVFEMFTAH